MKHLSNERGALQVLALILVLVLVAVVGVAVYNVSKSHQKATEVASTSPSASASPVTSASPTATATPAPTPSDQEQIVAALKAHYASNGQTPKAGSKFTLCRLENGYAIVGYSVGSGAGGGEVWLKKSQGTWAIAWEGQNYNPATQASSLGFPQGFGTSCTSNTVIFTY